MRIAQVAPLAERIPPELYGGTERVVSALTEELVRRGHAVTLFASGDSVTAAELVAITDRCVGRLEYPFESSGTLPWRVAAIHSESAAVTGVALSSPVLDKEPPDADSPVPPLCPTRCWA